MATLKELIAEKEELERRIAQTRTSARKDALEQIRTLMAESGLTLQDLAETKAPGRSKGSGKAPSKVAAKYRNPATGDAWSGRGLKPRWLKAELDAGRKIEDFAV